MVRNRRAHPDYVVDSDRIPGASRDDLRSDKRSVIKEIEQAGFVFGEEVPVKELKETYSAIEEAKADVSGLFALQFLVDRGKLDQALSRTMYTTYLASMFRSIRFGINEAHGRGVAMQLNYFLDNGGVTVAPDGTFGVNQERIRQNVIGLTRDIMTLQAVGGYTDARQMIDRLGVVRSPVQAVIDRLKDVPVDIEPRFVTAAQLEGNKEEP